jgi:hypothetical protein
MYKYPAPEWHGLSQGVAFMLHKRLLPIYAHKAVVLGFSQEIK